MLKDKRIFSCKGTKKKTLFDEFAMAALPAIISRVPQNERWSFEEIARSAYIAAANMLVQRDNTFGISIEPIAVSIKNSGEKK
jgi:hypothetical protein